MKDFGYNLGIAFQCMDDTLDYISTQEEFGKDIGKDLKEGKVTLPLIHTIQNSSSRDQKIIFSAIEKEEVAEKNLNLIMELIKKYQGIEYSIKKARSYAQAAKQALNGFASTLEKQALITVADYVVERRN